MYEVEIRGIPVKFPYKPYDIQKNYMEKIIECLQNNSHGVLESPTGTGKTLSLLCATLGWLEKQKAVYSAQNIQISNKHQLNSSSQKFEEVEQFNKLFGMPQIIYASRTHSQLSQAMQELKKTSYRYMNACVIGSREQMCVHPEVKKEETNSLITNLCQLKIKTSSCMYYSKVEQQKSNPVLQQESVIDIEDLVKFGTKHKFCPYYMSKELRQRADLIFMPYNYLLDPKMRKALGVHISSNTVVILDEAHNVEHMCEESASMQIQSTDISLCIEELTLLMKATSHALENGEMMPHLDGRDAPDFTPEELCDLKEILLKFENCLDKIPITSPKEGTSHEGDFIYKLMEEASITHENANEIIRKIDYIVQYISTTKESPFQKSGNGLLLFADLLRIAYAKNTDEFIEKVKRCYRVHIQVEEVDKNKNKNWFSKKVSSKKSENRILSFWCFSPGFGMKLLLDRGVQCVILTSGTLAPLNPLIAELEMTVNVRLENPHIVQNDQVCVRVISKGFDGEPLRCTYKNRDNERYLKSLGNTISNLARVIPNGLLIFFPSYAVMTQCQNKWQIDGTWNSISSQKTIFVEPRQKRLLQESMEQFSALANSSDNKGAIFMGVCRGKVSEGLDFADANGRAALIIGLPYPSLFEPKVILKRKYMNTCKSQNSEFLNGDEWYNLEAIKAVNQAIGRVIRHKNDYGAIIFMDGRFQDGSIQKNLSMWLRHRIQSLHIRDTLRELNIFFKIASAKYNSKTLCDSQNSDISYDNSSQTSNTTENSTKLISSALSCSTQPSQTENKMHNSRSENNIDLTNSPVSSYNKRLVLGNLEPSGSGAFKRKKIQLISNTPRTNASVTLNESTEDFLKMAKSCLNDQYAAFMEALRKYKNIRDIKEFILELKNIYEAQPSAAKLFRGLNNFILEEDKNVYECFRLTHDLFS